MRLIRSIPHTYSSKYSRSFCDISKSNLERSHCIDNSNDHNLLLLDDVEMNRDICIKKFILQTNGLATASIFCILGSQYTYLLPPYVNSTMAIFGALGVILTKRRGTNYILRFHDDESQDSAQYLVRNNDLVRKIFFGLYCSGMASYAYTIETLPIPSLSTLLATSFVGTLLYIYRKKNIYQDKQSIGSAMAKYASFQLCFNSIVYGAISYTTSNIFGLDILDTSMNFLLLIPVHAVITSVLYSEYLDSYLQRVPDKLRVSSFALFSYSVPTVYILSTPLSSFF
jgi:hypothetical protein